MTNALSRMPLAKKLRYTIVGNALVPAIAIILTLVCFAHFALLGKAQVELRGTQIRINHSAVALAEARRKLTEFKRIGDENLFFRAKSKLLESSNHVKNARNFGGDSLPVELQQSLAGYRQRIDNSHNRLIDMGAGAELVRLGGVENEMAEVFSVLNDKSQTLDKKAATKGTEMIDDARFAGMILLALALAAMLISFVAARKIIAGAIVSITQMTHAMEQLASGKTDHPIPETQREDELGAMARALVVFRQSALDLQEITQERAQAVEKELEQALKLEKLRKERDEALSKVADGFESTVLDTTQYVAEATGELCKTSTTMAALAKQSSEQTDSATQVMQSAAVGISAAAAASDQFALSIGEISQQASAAAELVREVKISVDSANGNISGLSQAVEEIGEITELIGSIAARTNLLSLNASIEAARGGEAGRGFAVVAAEVKELATRTSHATANVAAQIQAIQGITEESVSGLAQVAHKVVSLESSAISIAAAVDQQSISGRELAHNIDSVAASSDNVARTLDEVRSASLAAGEAAAQMLKSSQEAERNADELKAQTTRFLVEVRSKEKAQAA